MANDNPPRKIPVQSGSAGPAKRVEPARRGASADHPPSQRVLDERQARIRPTRRGGPKLEDDDGRRGGAARQIEDVPPTDCGPDAE